MGKLLVDNKVIVLVTDEIHVNQRLQKLLADDNNQLKVDDAAKIIGSWKAFSRQGTSAALASYDASYLHNLAGNYTLAFITSG